MTEMQFEVEKVSFDGVIYGTVTDRGRDLTKTAHEFMEHPASMPCRENACIVESEVRPNGWRIALRVKDHTLAEKIRTGELAISVGKSASGLLEFDITNIMKSCTCKKSVVFQPGACEYCREQAAAGEVPPYHDHCRCKIEKGVKTMSTELDTLNEQLEQIAEGYIQKNSGNPKAEHANAIAKASMSPEGARISKRIIELERHQAAMAAFRPDEPVQKSTPVESSNPRVREFDQLVRARMGEISKSADAPRSEKIVKAMATTAISVERPDLMREVIADERRQAAVLSFGGL